MFVELKDLQALKAERDALLSKLPQTPAGYKIELPKEVKLPDGYKLDPQNPIYGKFAEIAHEFKIPQEAYSRAIAVNAEHQVALDSAIRQAEQDKIKKNREALGVNGEQRALNVQQGLRNLVSSEKLAAALERAIQDADGVRAFEEILARKGVSFSAGSRAAETPGTTPEGWDKLTTRDKLRMIPQNNSPPRKTG